MFQIESGRVSLDAFSVRVPALVEGVPEHFSAEGRLSADQDSVQFSEFDVRLTIAAESKSASVTESYESAWKHK